MRVTIERFDSGAELVSPASENKYIRVLILKTINQLLNLKKERKCKVDTRR